MKDLGLFICCWIIGLVCTMFTYFFADLVHVNITDASIMCTMWTLFGFLYMKIDN